MATKRVPGNTFILCTFPLMMRGLANVLESDNNLSDLLGKIPDHIIDEDTLCVCRVGFWYIRVPGDESDSYPADLTTIMQIQGYEVGAIDDETVEIEES